MKLKNAALSYNELCNKKYEIIVAKKGKRHNIDLSFNINQFYHLVGVQHLKDINLNYRDKSIFFKDVLNDKINMKKISSSNFFIHYKIEDRIDIVQNLEKYLDSGDLKFRKYIPDYKFSKIEADYLFIKLIDSKYCNIFAKKDNKTNIYFLDSCNKKNTFIQHSNPLKVIYKKKIDLRRSGSKILIDRTFS